MSICLRCFLLRVGARSVTVGRARRRCWRRSWRRARRRGRHGRAALGVLDLLRDEEHDAADSGDDDQLLQLAAALLLGLCHVLSGGLRGADRRRDPVANGRRDVVAYRLEGGLGGVACVADLWPDRLGGLLLELGGLVLDLVCLGLLAT